MPSTLSASSGSLTHHPGPTQFWLLSLPFRVISWTFDSPASLTVASSMLSIVALAYVAMRLRHDIARPVELLAVSAFMSFALWQAFPSVATSPWNPDFGFVMFSCAVVACVVAELHGWRRPNAIAVLTFASLAAQAHLSYAFAAAALAVVAVYGVICSTRSEAARTAAFVIGALTLLWSGPLIDAAVNGGGNVVALVTASSSERAGLLAGFDRFVNSSLPWRFGLRRATDGTNFAAPATLIDRAVAVAIGLAVLWVARQASIARAVARLAVATTLLTMVATAAAPATLGTTYAAHTQRVWIVPVLLVWASLIAFAIDRRPPLIQQSVAVVPLLAIVSLTLLAGSAIVDGAASGSPEPACSAAVEQLADGVRPVLASVSVYDSSAVSFATLGTEQAMSTGLYAELMRQGADLGLRAGADAGSVPGHYFGPDGLVTAALVVTSAAQGEDVGGTLVASASCGAQGQRATIEVYVVSG
jgi:hypothetical protein